MALFAFKYAFPNGNAGTIGVELHANPERMPSLWVADDGIVLPVDLDILNVGSLGLQLVTSLLEQLDGALTIDGTHGVLYQITFARNFLDDLYLNPSDIN